MDVTSQSWATHEWLRKLRVDEYHQMISAGIFGEDEHVELLQGVLAKMSPQGTRHAWAIQLLNRELAVQLPREFAVRPQLPLTLGDDSEPEPDIAIVLARETGSRVQHPSTAVLVIEVSSDSLEKDRTLKSGLYAKAGVDEYWIVNLVDDCVEVHTKPDAATGSYAHKSIVKKNEPLAALALAFRIDAKTLFE